MTNAGERAAPRRRQQRHGRPGVLEPRVVVPQPVPTKGVPDPNEDHAGSGSLSDGPGESHPGRQLRGSGSHHITKSPALMSLLGRFLCEYNNYTITQLHNYTMLLLSAGRNQSGCKFSSLTEEEKATGEKYDININPENMNICHYTDPMIMTEHVDSYFDIWGSKC